MITWLALALVAASQGAWLAGTSILAAPDRMPALIDDRTQPTLALASIESQPTDPGEFPSSRAGLPTRAGQEWVIGSEASGRFIALTPEIATDASATSGPGFSRFSDAALDTDLAFVAEGDRVEEFRVLRSVRASTASRERLRLGHEIALVRRVAGRVDTLEALDHEGRVVLRTEPAYAIDARGARRAVVLSIQGVGAELSLVARLDTAGLTYPIVVDPSWTAAPSLGTARSDLTLTTLGGLVFAAGGFDASGNALSTFERFYSTGSPGWVVNKPMGTARGAHAAALLDPANLLIAGGLKVRLSVAVGDRLSSAEVWSGSAWTPTGPMSYGRFELHLASLGGGRALIVGADPLSEIYSLASNAWTASGSMSRPRGNIRPVVLGSGKVLAIGGYDGTASTILSSAEQWDPATGNWSAIASMSSPRAGYSVWQLASGKVLIAGGQDRPTTPGVDIHALSTSEIYDPSTDSWTAGPPLNTPRFRSSQTANGSPATMIVAGGSGKLFGSSDCEIYDGTANKWVLGPALVEFVLSPGVETLPDGRVIVAGGFHNIAPIATTGTFSLSNGDACPGAAPCASGNCVDGVCCDTLCADQCFACDLSATLGKCTPVTGAPHGARAVCTPTAGKCDSVAFTAPASCVAGACLAPAAKTCGNYACDATGCKAACGAQTDCAAGYICTASKCVPQPKGTCSMDHTTSKADTGTVTTCAPYLCNDSSGTCSVACGTSSDCIGGSTCETATKTCTPPTSHGGGGCAYDADAARRSYLGLAFGLLAIASRRRLGRSPRGAS